MIGDPFVVSALVNDITFADTLIDTGFLSYGLVYSAATVLNPSLKWAYMERTWEDKTDWIERAKSRVGQL
jgi:hypothetical protein